MALPDDVARMVLEIVASDCETRTSQWIDDDGSVPLWTIEVLRSPSTRAAACVCHQFARLMRRVLRTIGRRAYSQVAFGPTHLVFIELR